MKIRTRVIVALVTVALLLPLGASNWSARALEPAERLGVEYNVWTWNVAGWEMNAGSTTNGMTATAASSILNRDADLVAFNELCWSQYLDIKQRLIAAGWPDDTSNFSRFRWNNQTSCGGEALGIAIFTRQPLGQARGTVLPQDSSATRRVLLCAPLTTTADLQRFCTTHITPSNDIINGSKINEQQLDAARNRLQRYYDEDDARIIIAGDFNAQPNYGRLNDWYSPTLNVPNNPNNTGDYREVDDQDTRCLGYGERTVHPNDNGGECFLGKKIDLIFVREEYASWYGNGDSLSVGPTCGGGPCSDHRIVIGTIVLRTT